MKIEKLTENKIRVILNLEDIKSKNLDLHSFMSNSVQSQDFFRDMLNKAEEEVGFTTSNCRLLIEALASIEGDFIFTITKFASSANDLVENNKKKVIVKRKTVSLSKNTVTYAFNSFDEFCNFCTFIHNSNLKDLKQLSKHISLFNYNTKYYLVIANIDTNFQYLNNFYASISEFAKLVNHSKNFEAKLLEHGKLIFKNNAINKGIEFFVKD